MIVSDHNNSFWGTNVPGHRRVWAQSCLGTIVSGHSRVWAQSCGPSRVGPIMYGHKRGGTTRNMLISMTLNAPVMRSFSKTDPRTI